MRCRYRDFKVFGRDGFQQTLESLYVDSSDSSTWRYKRRGTVLGMMHQHKREMWEQAIAFCPNQAGMASELELGRLTPLCELETPTLEDYP